MRPDTPQSAALNERGQKHDRSDRAPTGIPGLDDVLHGGFPRNHVYLLEGDPGTGKTTLALQFLLAGCHAGEEVLYIALSETASELHGIGESHGWSLDGIDIFELTPVEASIRPGEEYTIFHSEEVEMAETIKLILDRIEQRNPTRVVLDSLAELRLLARDSIRYRRQILALKQNLAAKSVTVLLLDDRTSHHNDRQMHSVVHGVVALERFQREYGNSRRRMEISKLRGAEFVEGYHDFSISRGGLTVYPRLVAVNHHVPFEREMVSSNIPGIDHLLGGGLDRGSSTLFVGPSGSGKTTLAMKYALAAVDRAETAAIYTFDEGIDSLLARAGGLGMQLRTHIDEGKISIQHVNPAELSPGAFAHRVRRSVEKGGVRTLVIDSLNGYMTAMPEESFLSLQLHELLMYLSTRGVVTVLILAQQGVFGSMPSNIDLSYLTDNILLLRFFEAAGEVRRAISVVKKRTSQHEHSIREFKIGGPEGVQVGQPLTGFQGVLTGIPEYTGDIHSLQQEENER
jgi:circadian clock protein KaiC